MAENRTSNEALAYRYVLLDCDGTILDTFADLMEAGNHVCRLHGWPVHDTDDYRKMLGNGQRKLVERFTPEELRGDADFLEAVYEQYCTYYDQHKQDRTTIFEGIVEMLDHLQAAGVQCGVLTNKNEESALPIIEHYFPGRFQWVQGRVDTLPPKPYPPLTEALMKRMGAVPEQTLVVGDTNVDIECGVMSGLDSCGVLWGMREREELVQAGATYLASTPAELESVILTGRV